MSLSATAGWQRSWTMVNGQHLLRISGPWWFTCRRQQQQQQHCVVRPPPFWACFVCRPNNWPYLWDILAFYVSIFPLALHTFLALWPGQVTTILVFLPTFCAVRLNCFRPCFCGTWTSFRKQFHAHFVGVEIGLLSIIRTDSLSVWPWPDAEAKKTSRDWEKNRSQAFGMCSLGAKVWISLCSGD